MYENRRVLVESLEARLLLSARADLAERIIPMSEDVRLVEVGQGMYRVEGFEFGEPVSALLGSNNVESADTINVEQITDDMGFDLSGEGVTVGVFDGIQGANQILNLHEMLNENGVGRVFNTVFSSDSGNPESHQTHVAATIGADGIDASGNTNLARDMAVDVLLRGRSLFFEGEKRGQVQLLANRANSIV